MVKQMDEELFGHCSNTEACEVECPQGISVLNIARMNYEYGRSLFYKKTRKKHPVAYKDNGMFYFKFHCFYLQNFPIPYLLHLVVVFPLVDKVYTDWQ